MKRLLRKILRSRIISYDYKIVNIYVENDDKLTLIPTGESKKWHMITDLDFSIELIPPYTDKELEEKLFEAMKMCFSYEPDDVAYKSVSEKANASKIFSKKVKGKKLISLSWDKIEGYRVEPYKRAKDRGFSIIDENVITLDTPLEERTLANAIKEAMKISELY